MARSDNECIYEKHTWRKWSVCAQIIAVDPAACCPQPHLAPLVCGRSVTGDQHSRFSFWVELPQDVNSKLSFLFP